MFFCDIILNMKLNLAQYRGKKICVALSGGRDSMALLHCLMLGAGQYKISVCAVNCDHKLRACSAEDSAFVKDFCNQAGVPIVCFEENCAALSKNRGVSVETAARDWRRECYLKAASMFGADAVATAHHMNDNAETVLFNLARGAALSGLTGICDGEITAQNKFEDGGSVKVIRPLIGCTREEIDEYVRVNGVPFVEDETNADDCYTRNYIRLNVLPRLEEAVPSATKSIFRFSRLAAEDEKYFAEEISRKKLIEPALCGVYVNFCEQKPLFMRAAVSALKYLNPLVKDYTAEQIERLYNLQFCGNGKKFYFLDFVAFKEDGKISVCLANCLNLLSDGQSDFNEYVLSQKNGFGGQYAAVCDVSALSATLEKAVKETVLSAEDIKILKFDCDKIPAGATIRFMRKGDRFQKFGGGCKNLGDYFTDKKIPLRLRGLVPLIALGSEIYAVCGVEISDKIKITDKTQRVGCILCADYARFK